MRDMERRVKEWERQMEGERVREPNLLEAMFACSKSRHKDGPRLDPPPG